jgi:hypothetical protein
MKKIFLAVLTAIIAFSFIACEKTDKTRTELLTQKKGWELYTATSIPAFLNKEGVSNENLFISFFWACELDDILNFNENGSSIMNHGKVSCEEGEGKETSLGNWRFLKDEEVLEFYLPFFFNEDDSFARLEAKVVTLDENTLQLRIPISYDNGVPPAKSGKIVNDRGMTGTRSITNYEFILTYKVAK